MPSKFMTKMPPEYAERMQQLMDQPTGMILQGTFGGAIIADEYLELWRKREQEYATLGINAKVVSQTYVAGNWCCWVYEIMPLDEHSVLLMKMAHDSDDMYVSCSDTSKGCNETDHCSVCLKADITLIGNAQSSYI